MQPVKVTLTDGIELGGVKQVDVVMRHSMAADYLDALEESERAVLAPTGEFDENGNPILVPTLLPSAALMDIHTVRRQVISFGDIPADPLPIEQLRLLSNDDLELIRVAAEQLEERTPVEVVQRGRLDPASEDHSSVNGSTDVSQDDDTNRIESDDAEANEQLGGGHHSGEESQ